MRKKVILTFLLAVCSMWSFAQGQVDSYLQDMTKVVKELRKGSNVARNAAVSTLSADKKPKITLMDEVQWAGGAEEKANEVKGAKGNRFKLNQVIAYVYKKQNHQLETKSNMLNGNERDIHYCAIEKSVKLGGKLTYQIKGHAGSQDFVFVPFNPKTQYVVKVSVDGTLAGWKEATDVWQIHLPRLTRQQTITISIEYLNNKVNKDQVESFAILNYNPQK